MDFNIYSVGDASFLQKVLNGVAMIVGTNDFVTCCVIGVFFGLLLAGVSTVLTGRGPDVTSLVLCLVFWVFMFGSTVTVNIHDVFNDTDRKVDNVPTGVAIAGWGISNIGFGLTEIMEQAYAPPIAQATLTGGGLGSGGKFMEPLYLLNTIAKIGDKTQVVRALDKVVGNNTDMSKTLHNYVADCTWKKLYFSPNGEGGASWQDMMTQPSEEALELKSDIFYTLTFMGGSSSSSGTHQTCTAAWAKITEQLNKYKQAFAGQGGETELTKALTFLLNDNRIDPATGILKGTSTLSDWTSDSAQALGIDQNVVMDVAEASLLYDYFISGMATGFENARERNTALMLKQAKEQRNVQWAAEHSMFVDTMRPMMTFIEGFTYAITPFAAFLMMMGMFGLKLIGKYFMLLAWTQSWLPVTAIVQLYLYDTVRQGLRQYKYSGSSSLAAFEPGSFYGLNDILSQTAQAISVGGMFGAAVPLITLFLFTGSIYSLTTLTGRMAGSDFVQEKYTAPDNINPAAIAQIMPHATNTNGIETRTGFTWPTLTWSDNLTNSATDVKQWTQAVNSQLTSSWLAGITEKGGTLNTDAIGTIFSNTKGFLGEEGVNAVIQHGRSLAEGSGVQLSNEQAYQLGLTGHLDAPMLNASLSASEKDALNRSINSQKSKGVQSAFSRQHGAKVQEALSSALSQSKNTSTSYGFEGSNATTFNEAYTNSQNYSESFNKTQQQARSFGANNSRSVLELAKLIEDNSSITDMLEQRFNTMYRNADAGQQRFFDTMQQEMLKQSGTSGGHAAMLYWMSTRQNALGVEGDNHLVQITTAMGLRDGEYNGVSTGAMFDENEVRQKSLANAGVVGRAQSEINNARSQTDFNPLTEKNNNDQTVDAQYGPAASEVKQIGNKNDLTVLRKGLPSDHASLSSYKETRKTVFNAGVVSAKGAAATANSALDSVMTYGDPTKVSQLYNNTVVGEGLKNGESGDTINQRGMRRIDSVMGSDANTPMGKQMKKQASAAIDVQKAQHEVAQAKKEFDLLTKTNHFWEDDFALPGYWEKKDAIEKAEKGLADAQGRFQDEQKKTIKMGLDAGMSQDAAASLGHIPGDLVNAPMTPNSSTVQSARAAVRIYAAKTNKR